jgi:hypothetical protein
MGTTALVTAVCVAMTDEKTPSHRLSPDVVEAARRGPGVPRWQLPRVEYAPEAGVGAPDYGQTTFTVARTSESPRERKFATT